VKLHHVVLTAVGSFAAVSLLAGGAVLANPGGSASLQSPIPRAKQAVIDRERAEQARLQALPRVAKPASQPAFLPNPAPSHAPSIRPYRGFGPFKGGAYMTTIATVVTTSKVDYTVYAGALDTDPQQGVLVVFRGADPPNYIGGSTARSYLWPTKSGLLTITNVEGDNLVVRTQDGTVGRFNLTAGYLLP
jgi:hypothetical protein